MMPALVPLLLPRITSAALTAGAASPLAADDGRARVASACPVLRRSSLAALPLSRPGSGGGDGSGAVGGGVAVGCGGAGGGERSRLSGTEPAALGADPVAAPLLLFPPPSTQDLLHQACEPVAKGQEWRAGEASSVPIQGGRAALHVAAPSPPSLPPSLPLSLPGVLQVHGVVTVPRPAGRPSAHQQPALLSDI